ncbi:MAG: OB-fold nucleic acid binding domain-containing protein, partial [Candidatus Odinarchaeota archaeon]
MDTNQRPIKRAPAKKLHIKTILESQLDTDCSPPVLRLNNGETCSRVRLLGLVVNKRTKNGLTEQVDAEYNVLSGENINEIRYTSIDLDDGTAVINVRAWDDEAACLSKYNIGEMVEIIGKPKEYAGRLYVLYECGLVVNDIHWWFLHELNILKDRLDKQYESKGQDQFLTGNLNKHIINNLIGDKAEVSL